ncbi:ABC transporter permease [Streptomyces hydrogenans]|uniref:ABC transporter permease n=1 Tax=Streptomyces hydrogenans TaxID=1873719 RepID=UPI003818EA94
MLLHVNAAFVVLLAVLLGLAAAVVSFARLGPARRVLFAGARATVQLVAVSFLIGWVVRAVPLTLCFLLLMYAVAVRTAGRRVVPAPGRSWPWTALPIGAGVLPVVAALLLTGVLPPRGIALVPITGILIGGALTATVLAGRRALDELATRHGEVEAGLALGLTDRDARMEVARPAAADALIPGMDQTRTVGLVTLPGAFVGMLLGGASPWEAGAVQLFVLVALLLVQAVATAITLELVALGTLRRPGTPPAETEQPEDPEGPSARSGGAGTRK